MVADQSGSSLFGPSPDETTANYLNLRRSMGLITTSTHGLPPKQEDNGSDPTGRHGRENDDQPTSASARGGAAEPGPSPKSSKAYLVELRDDEIITAVENGIPIEAQEDGTARISASYLGGTGRSVKSKKGRGGGGGGGRRSRSNSVSRTRSTRGLGETKGLSQPTEHRLFTPGPGRYNLAYKDRKGGQLLSGTSVGFAQSGRILDKVLLEHNESPGPCYMPKESKMLSTRKTDAQTVFGRYGVSSRFNAAFGEPANAPFYNPGPGAYRSRKDRAGGELLSSGAKIGTAACHRTWSEGSMERSVSNPVYITKEHERMNLGAHSPGPAAYNPSEAAKKVKSSDVSYTLRARGIPMWSEITHPRHTFTPGPNYTPRTDRKGKGELGDAPKFRYGRGPQRDHPEELLSRSAYISEDHSRVSNYTLHSPPFSIYDPQPIGKHVAGPKLGSGPPRLYNRFELGRI